MQDLMHARHVPYYSAIFLNQSYFISAAMRTSKKTYKLIDL